ncbi:hypothetical protein MVEG_07678 [Podila verticillata NRRL 6337]|nr:hypothetical protein MVEG_07678 [Podila verticillata NRRL 6337]
MHPAAGQGAVNAMQGAITLANVIASIPSKDEERNISKAFKKYKAERFPVARSAFNLSHTLSKSFERTLQGAMIRYSMMRMPPWLNKTVMAKLIVNRPQVNFLPRAEDKGTVMARYRPSLHRPPKVVAV